MTVVAALGYLIFRSAKLAWLSGGRPLHELALCNMAMLMIWFLFSFFAFSFYSSYSLYPLAFIVGIHFSLADALDADPPMSLHPVSIVIPNYNGEQIIGASLDAVTSAAAAYGGDCEVILVDDASTDRSVEIVSAMDPAVRLVRHAVNQGFSAAARSGVSAARHDRIILLNSDVHPHPFIAPLVAALDDESVFAASPLVTDAAENPQFVSWTRYRIVRGKLKARSWRLEDAEARRAQGLPLQGLYASGGSMAFQTGALPRARRLPRHLQALLQRGSGPWHPRLDARLENPLRTREPGDARRHRNHQALLRRPAVRTTRIRNRLIFLSLYAYPQNCFFSYIPWNLLRMLTRLLSLDSTMLAAFSQLIRMTRTVVALRTRITTEQPFKTIERILEDVNAD